ncbi:MAG: pyridoxal-phosphate dependent enzyme [Melioribacteraceae bacterium]|nr:pyridoxal-phosphate dependent enzyme [Melioribacteraceae bacterium]
MNIRDSVRTSDNKISGDVKVLSDAVKDKSYNLIDRLEAFEDIINIEVGDTTLKRTKTIEREYELRQLYIKFEGDNPTGTQKDRIAFAQIFDALRRGYDEVGLATCGNYGVSMALASKLSGIKCHIYIPDNYHSDRLDEMSELGATIHRTDGSYEDAVKHSSGVALSNEWYDANPGGLNTPLQIISYSHIAIEIYEELRDAPKYCAVPVSNGTLLAGIYRGFVSLYKRGRTSRIPKMIAASSVDKNPIVNSFLKKYETCEDLKPELIKETKLNEPLINWHSFDGEEALYALHKSEGAAYNISDKSMKDMYAFLSKKEGIRVLPASTAGLIALLRLHEKERLEPDRYVAVLTAKY